MRNNFYNILRFVGGCLNLKMLTPSNIEKGKYGFIKGRSAVLQLLRILDEWTEMLEGGQIDVIIQTLKCF